MHTILAWNPVTPGGTGAAYVIVAQRVELCYVNFARWCHPRPRFLLGLLTGAKVASKTIVSDVCGKEHDTAGMGVTTGELW